MDMYVIYQIQAADYQAIIGIISQSSILGKYLRSRKLL